MLPLPSIFLRRFVRAGAAVALVLVAVAATAATAAPAPAPVPLHPAVGDTLDALEAARFGLFADEPGLRSVVILPAPWGGYLARLTVVKPDGPVVRERNVTTAQLRAWRARIEAVLAGAPLPPEPAPAAPAPVAPPPAAPPVAAATDSTASAPAAAPTGHVRVWPEVPLPPPRHPTPLPGAPPPEPPPTRPARPAHWFVTTGLGYRHCASDWRRYFTDMGQLQLVVSHRPGSWLSPYGQFIYGFGGIRKDFEAATPYGGGRSALYALELGVTARTPVTARGHAYAGLGGGYYMRSLRWGDYVFQDAYGYTSSGTLVAEFRNWGVTAQAGFQLALGRPGRGRSQRLLDFQLRVEDYARTGWEPLLKEGVDPARFRIDARDRWVAFSVSLVNGL